MKRIFNLILASSVALGFAACNNDKAPQSVNTGEGTTYAGMYISGEKSIAPRAANNYVGRDAESALVSLDLLSTGGPQSWALGTTPDEAGKFWEVTPNSKVYKVAPWLTTAGNHAMALIVNKGSLTLPAPATADAYLYGASTTVKDDIAALSTESAFVMTSARVTKNVLDGKDETTVKDGTDETTNVFKFDLERVVVQGMVAKGAALAPETKDKKGTIDLTTLKYAAVNGAVQTYLFANNAGERHITDATGQYTDYKSAIDAYTEFANAEDHTTVADKLIRLGNLGSTNEALGGYKAIPVAGTADAAKAARGIYFLENSVDKTAFTSENKKAGFYRLAYAKVYAQYTPKEVYTWDAKTSVMNTKTIDAGTTFYKGVEDGLLYDSMESAMKSTVSPDQKAFTFTNGMCAYRALWNRQEDTTGKTVTSADTRRNNVYLLTITEFEGLGMPWDPSDPNDPNLPKPVDDPTEDPVTPNIETFETYMRVEAKVLPWNLVERNVSLKN